MIRISQNPTIAMRIWNQWVQDSHADRKTSQHFSGGQTFCQVGLARSYSHIKDIESENGLACCPSITRLVHIDPAARTECTATIILTSLGPAA
ncbi:hypothetical protein TNCV_1939811 [Trichonephila clavipes]|nr:hypothetical protein TNCV_1939811 [Trichonephila clavipes]